MQMTEWKLQRFMKIIKKVHKTGKRRAIAWFKWYDTEGNGNGFTRSPAVIVC